MSDLVGNPEDQFSHNEAQITQGRQYRKLKENEQQNKPQKSYHLGNDGNKLLGGLLDNLSRRLIDELVGTHGRASVRRLLSASFTMLKHLFIRNCWANQSQIVCEASLDRWDEIFSWHLDRITKMAATPMYSKIPSKSYVCMYIYICVCVCECMYV